jgi:glycosyltransferase involved in cell wall biosynthesis
VLLKNNIKILALTKYDSLGASSRLRTIQYTEPLMRYGFDVDVFPLISNKMLKKRYEKGNYGLLNIIHAYAKRFRALLIVRSYDLVIVEKESLPWVPVWIELYLLSKRPYTLDLDDATFHNYDLHRFWLVRFIFGTRLDKLMLSASCVTCGNDYLKARASKAGANDIMYVPTVVDLDKYTLLSYDNKKREGESIKIVWIGTPATQKYLNLVSGILTHLAAIYDFTLVVVGSDNFTSDKFNVQRLNWNESTENEVLSQCDIGIMPLFDDKWERGKCGYKLIQYSASGLPVIGSSIGVNRSIIDHGRTGFLAADKQDWIYALETLFNDVNLRHKMGRAGRSNIELSYNLKTWTERLSKTFEDIS